MTLPFRKPPAVPPAWLPVFLAREIEASGTNAFLVAGSPAIRLERWGSTLRALVSGPEFLPFNPSLLQSPGGFPWSPRRILWQNEGEAMARHLAGEGWAEVVSELGLTYGIDLTPGTSPGLFPDQRENRAFLRSRRPRSLLNLFAHTCAFGVLAASVGSTTLNIDTSARALGRGRENFRRNQIHEKHHRFWKEDVRQALPRLVRRGESFDSIILDPPTFAHAQRGRAFRVEKELEPLLSDCLRILAPGGVLLVSINESTMNPTELKNKVDLLLARQKIRAKLAPSRRPPEVPENRMPAGVWVIRED